MRAYDRSTGKRWVRREVQAQGAPARPRGGGGPSPGPARFAEVLAAGLAHVTDPGLRARLGRVARCAGLELGRAHACGAERRALGAWCRHPYCPACARERAAAAARAARTWDSRVLVVEVPIGQSDRLELPSAAAVASLRAAWGRVSAQVAERTALPRLQPVPRAVVGPGGLTLLLRLPWGEREPGRLPGAEACFAHEVAAACRRAGFRALVRATSREEASRSAQAAVTAEADRFGAEVAGDLARLDALAWRARFPGDASAEAALRAVSRRWIAWLDARGQRRRTLVLGSRGGLALGGAPGPASANPACPAHGAGCRAVAAVVRDRRRRLVARREDLELPRAVTTQALEAFLAEAAPPLAALAPLEPRRAQRRAG